MNERKIISYNRNFSKHMNLFNHFYDYPKLCMNELLYNFVYIFVSK